MKKLKLNIFHALIILCVMLTGACSNDKLCDEADILYSFKVYRMDGTTRLYYNGIMGDDNVITLKISPHRDVQTELSAAYPLFYLSKGATVTPDPSEPQDFTQSGGVKYTVTSENGKNQKEYTVLWDISDPLPYGEGLAHAEPGAGKDFVELGYPGVFGVDGGVSIEYGDVIVYNAYCGDYIVLLSRRYVEEPAFGPSSPHCVKVVDKITLDEADVSFNLGAISLPALKMIASDYKGRCVGVVTTGGETEFFYWTTPADAPRSIGKIGVNMAPMASLADHSSNFQVAGDITGNAWITALAPRGVAGEHYRVKVTNGQLASNYSTVTTGYPSNDCNQFQMISPLDDSDNPSYVVGDVEGTVAANGSVKCYINSPAGTTTFVMLPFWNNGLPTWPYWVQTGQSLTRTGARRPVVSALSINGKSYVVVTSGSAYYPSAAVLTDDLQKLAHQNLSITLGSFTVGWSYGSWVDWYFDDDTKEAYLAIWFERYGLYTFNISCFE